uniref:Uncharacterized protein n=2 Tax=Picea TaxID=3328 RepID=A0A124GP90_PICGL|nr:hypothetical protein ABT39_MTgene1078 [Picea glauca]QHR89997.1 hypothetical protein Q903MT_gene4019 [Picea sitchensis]
MHWHSKPKYFVYLVVSAKIWECMRLSDRESQGTEIGQAPYNGKHEPTLSGNRPPNQPSGSVNETPHRIAPGEIDKKDLPYRSLYPPLTSLVLRPIDPFKVT